MLAIDDRLIRTREPLDLIAAPEPTAPAPNDSAWLSGPVISSGVLTVNDLAIGPVTTVRAESPPVRRITIEARRASITVNGVPWGGDLDLTVDDAGRQWIAIGDQRERVYEMRTTFRTFGISRARSARAQPAAVAAAEEAATPARNRAERRRAKHGKRARRGRHDWERHDS